MTCYRMPDGTFACGMLPLVAYDLDDTIDQDDRDRAQAEKNYEDHLMNAAQNGF